MFSLRTLILIASSMAALLAAERVLGQTRAMPSQPFAQSLSDLSPDPAIRFGTLPNGMRYELRHNATPPKQVALRLRIDAGSLLEKDDQRGLAHFMEHMAFNGTTHLPADELVQTLQRNGLNFGTDLNASTSFDQTIYKLDVPSASGEALDTALHILREQASEALMTSKDIDDERGVIAGEQRLRDSPALRAQIAKLGLIAPRIASRVPIGDMEIIRTAPRERFVDFYNTYYRPSRATLVAVGDFDVDAMEARIKRAFFDWTPKVPDAPDRARIPVSPGGIATRIHLEPGSGSTVELLWTRSPDLRPDSIAKQRDSALSFVGLSALNQRFQEMSHADRPPFLSAVVTKTEMYHTLEVTDLRVEFLPGHLKEAMAATEREQRRLSRYGITEAELSRIVDQGRNFMKESVAGAATEQTPGIADGMVSDINARRVSLSRATRLALFEREVNAMTPAAVNTAIRTAFGGAGPLVFVTTPTPLEGGEAAVTQDLAAARTLPVSAPPTAKATIWSYTAFGNPGAVLTRREIPKIGATVVVFANGTTLTVKSTHFTDNRVLVSATTGIGQLGMVRDRMDPLYGAQTYLIDGGLGKLSRDEIERALAGRSFSIDATIEQDRFKWAGATRTEELPLEMQVLAAYVTDPGLRPGPLEREKATFATQLSSARATAGGAWQVDSRKLLTSGDHREAVPTVEEIGSLSMPTVAPLLRRAIGVGPIHVIVVGDVTIDQAIATTAATFGALSPRAPAPPTPAGSEVRRFPTPAGATATLHHTGPSDQALAFVGWPGPDSVSDNADVLRAQVLTRALNLRVLQEIREREALAYSPAALIAASHVFPRYGYIGVVAETKPEKIPAFYDAVDRLAADLRDRPISSDELDRVQRPLVEQFRNLLTTNQFWLDNLRDVDTRPERVEQIIHVIPVIQAVTVSDIQALAGKYLKPRLALRAQVTPR